MRRLALIFLLAATALPVVGAELTPEDLRRARARVESLLGNRRGASPAPVNPANPFVLPQAAPTVQTVPVPAGDVPLTRSDNLARLAASLNVSGYLLIQGVPHLAINRLTYRENDLIPVREANGSVSFLLLKSIAGGNFVLELDGAELEQKHTVK